MMKNIKFIITFLTLALVLSACEEETYEFGDLIAPSNVTLTSSILGSETNPEGDGSGTVTFTASADNEITYQFIYNGAVSMAPNGVKTYNFKSATGPVGTKDVNKHIVTVVALGKGGLGSSTSVEVDVLAPNVPPPVIIEDFEGDELAIEAFGGDGVYAVYKDNPDTSGINASSTVIEHKKASGSETWAGFVFGSSKINMNLYSKTSIKIYSPTAGTPIQFKLETSAGNSGPIKEVITNTTVSGKWEEITFDFSEVADENWVRIVIFCDWATKGNDAIYYIDDIKLLN